MSRRIVFEASAFEDFNDWAATDKKIYKRIVSLLKDIDRSPFSGIGKPEPLKHDWQGYWSRRINHEHRLVYKVTDTAVVVAACRYHY
jgi:toxin YoeB